MPELLSRAYPGRWLDLRAAAAVITARIPEPVSPCAACDDPQGPGSLKALSELPTEEVTMNKTALPLTAAELSAFAARVRADERRRIVKVLWAADRVDVGVGKLGYAASWIESSECEAWLKTQGGCRIKRLVPGANACIDCETVYVNGQCPKCEE